MAKDWSEAEIAILRTRREQRIPVPQIAAELGRPVPATYARARLIGTKVMDRRAWNDEEVARLRDLDADDVPIKTIAEILARTRTSVSWKLDELGLSGRRLRRWTSGEINRLRRLLADGGDVAAFARACDRPVVAVEDKAKELGYIRKSRVYWSAEAERRLRDGVRDLARVADDLGMALEAVVGKARKLGLIGDANDVAGMDGDIRASIADGGGIDALARRTGKSARALRARAESIGALRVVVKSRRVELAEAATIRTEVARVGVTAVAKAHARDVRTVNRVLAERSGDRAANEREVARFLAENGVSRVDRGKSDGLVLALRRRGYSVVGDGRDGWIVDGRVGVVDPDALVAFAALRGISA